MPRELNFDSPDEMYERFNRKQNRRLGQPFRDVQLESDRLSASDLEATDIPHAFQPDAMTIELAGRGLHTCSEDPTRLCLSCETS